MAGRGSLWARETGLGWPHAGSRCHTHTYMEVRGHKVAHLSVSVESAAALAAPAHQLPQDQPHSVWLQKQEPARVSISCFSQVRKVTWPRAAAQLGSQVEVESSQYCRTVCKVAKQQLPSVVLGSSPR